MKIAIVGCGCIAQVHGQCITRMKDHQLVAAADCKLDKAKQFVALYGGKPYQSMEEMIEKEEIDVIHICTPHYLHVPMAIYALEHNIHVFMEKPPVINRVQYKELQDAVKKSKARLGLCLQNRYNPTVLKVKEILSDPTTGKIKGAMGTVFWKRDEPYYTQSDWRGTTTKEGGGALINQGVHTMDLLQYFIGETPVSTDTVMTNHHLKGIIEVEDMVSMYITYPESIACLYITTAFSSDLPPVIQLDCEHVRIRMEQNEITYYYKDGTKKTIEVELKKGYGKGYWGAGHEDCITDFYDCIRTGKTYAQDLEHIAPTIELLLNAYE